MTAPSSVAPSESSQTPTGSSRGAALWGVFQMMLWLGIVLLTTFTTLHVLAVLLHMPWTTDRVHAARLFASALADNLFLLGHIATAVPCLVIGPWLFVARLRNRFLTVHRWLGKVYVFGVLSSAVLGFVLAMANPFGWVPKAGFGTLAVVWFTTTFIAYRYIRGGDRDSHRRWMVRSYAISIAVITVRFLGTPEGMSAAEWSPIVSWLCWVPNAIVGEIYARITDPRGRLRFLRPGGSA